MDCASGCSAGYLAGCSAGCSAGYLARRSAGWSAGLLFGLLFGSAHGAELRVCSSGWCCYVSLYPALLALAHALLSLQGGALPEDATVRILLRRVGGGYSFIHHLLLDYFAFLNTELTPASAAPPPALTILHLQPLLRHEPHMIGREALVRIEKRRIGG